MTTTTRSLTQFTIREATESDLAACSTLDLSYETEYAWQIDVRDEEGAIIVGALAPTHARQLPARRRHNLA